MVVDWALLYFELRTPSSKVLSAGRHREVLGTFGRNVWLVLDT